MSGPTPTHSLRHRAVFQIATLLLDATRRFARDFLYQESEHPERLVNIARVVRRLVVAGGSGEPDRFRMDIARRTEQCERPNSFGWQTGSHWHGANQELRELMLNYQDYMRWNRWPQWSCDGEEAKKLRAVLEPVSRESTDVLTVGSWAEMSDEQRWQIYAPWFDHSDPTVRANAVLTVAGQLETLIEEFAFGRKQLELSEMELRPIARMARESNEQQAASSISFSDSPPTCPLCGGTMRLRLARQGQHMGRQFWGCNGYPHCRGVAEAEPL